MSNVVKCSVCNIVIDEMLCFIQNKVSIMDEESLVRICSATFTSDEIKNSKSLLFESIPTDIRKIMRKNKGKEERNIADIINVFKSSEPDLIPTFVARQLDKLPPILIDHLDCSKLLKDMQVLKAEIDGIKSTYATRDSVNNVKSEIFRSLRNDSLTVRPPSSMFKVNTRRGAWLDSGPMEISHDCLSPDVSEKKPMRGQSPLPIDGYREILISDTSLNEQPKSVLNSGYPHLDLNLATDDSTSPGRKTDAGAGCEEGGRPLVTHNANAPSLGGCRGTDMSSASNNNTADSCISHAANDCTASENKLKECKSTIKESTNDNDSDWQKVTKRKKQTNYRYLGKFGAAKDLNCTFRAADKKIPMFITNVHLLTTESDIIKHIYNKTQETVYLERINMKSERGHKAYKFFISETNIPKYMDETLWPTGVIFRRFVNYKHRKTNIADFNVVDGSHKYKNG